MRVSLFFEIPTTDPADQALMQRRFDEALDAVELADQNGFATVWAVEHHFLPGFAALSSPELFLAAASQRTKRIRLGHAIMHLPFRINPTQRVAERIATLDILSHGRVEFGGGRASSFEELGGFGVDPEDTRAQQAEAMRMLPRMWMDETFSWDSPLFQMPPRKITPKPVQKPHPPMWVSCSQPSTIKLAARMGVGVLGFGISDAAGADLVTMYREEIKAAQPVGAFVNNQFAMLKLGLCCRTDEEALAIQGPNLRIFSDQTAILYSGWTSSEQAAPPSYAGVMKRFLEGRERMLKYTAAEMIAAGGAVIGSPETCRRMLQ